MAPLRAIVAVQLWPGRFQYPYYPPIRATIEDALQARVEREIVGRVATCQKYFPGIAAFSLLKLGTPATWPGGSISDPGHAEGNGYVLGNFWEVYAKRTDTNTTYEETVLGPPNQDGEREPFTNSLSYSIVSKVEGDGKIKLEPGPTSHKRYDFNGDGEDASNPDYYTLTSWLVGTDEGWNSVLPPGAYQYWDGVNEFIRPTTYVSPTKVTWDAMPDLGIGQTTSELSGRIDIAPLYETARDAILAYQFLPWPEASSVGAGSIYFNEAANFIGYGVGEGVIYLPDGRLSYGWAVLDHASVELDNQSVWDNAKVLTEGASTPQSQVPNALMASGCGPIPRSNVSSSSRRGVILFRGQIKMVVGATKVWVARFRSAFAVNLTNPHAQFGDSVVDVEIVKLEVALSLTDIYEVPFRDPGPPPWPCEYAAGPAAYANDYNFAVEWASWTPSAWCQEYIRAQWGQAGVDCSAIDRNGVIRLTNVEGESGQFHASAQ